MNDRLVCICLASALVALGLAGSGAAATVVGTARGDTLRGTPKADVLDGRGGSDRVFGLGGNDVLRGGSGNDVLTGGAGADRYSCGAGADVAIAAPGDTIASDCETVRGLPGVAIRDTTGAEGDAGTQLLSFPVTLSRAVTAPVTVGFRTTGGTATAGVDFVAASGTITFAPGETSKNVEVVINSDIDVEPDETLVVELASPRNAVIAARSATGTIRNEDRPRPRVGRYAGTTSQGRSISFEVSPDLRRMTQISIGFDFSCPAVGASLPNERFDLADAGLPIAFGSWSFGFDVPINEQDVTGTVSFHGALAAPGTASGTFRLDLTINGISCSSGAVTWNAS